MSDPAPIRIEAMISQAEGPALKAAAEQLSTCLGSAIKQVWPIQLGLRGAVADIETADPGAVVVVSPLMDAERVDEPWAAAEARWRERAHVLAGLGPPLVLCTVFRVVAGRVRLSPGGATPPVLERIRRLDRLIADLSRETGCYVAEIDRAMAHLGAARLQADYRLASRVAAEVAGHAIVWTLLSGPLDDIVPPEVQEQARAIQGHLTQIETLLRRRLAPA